MRRVIFKNQFLGRKNLFDIDGQKFRIILESFESIGGYAPCVIEDVTTGLTHYSSGCLEIRGYVFETKWGTKYDMQINNYLTTRNLEVFIY